MAGVQRPALLHHLVDDGRTPVRSIHLVALLHAGHHVLQGLWGIRGVREGLSPKMWAQLHPPLTRIQPLGVLITHNSRIRHSPEGVDFPEEDPEAPHVRLGGEFLQGEKQAQAGVWDLQLHRRLWALGVGISSVGEFFCWKRV